MDLGPAGEHGEVPIDNVTYFDDEVSEVEPEVDMEEEDHDLEDLLITQHYLSDEEATEEE